ncbi:MAG: hypothetical protein GY816_24475 [Cytophagales bacterium]|nr:hypothetical protein [Cytophagales bacterium]
MSRKYKIRDQEKLHFAYDAHGNMTAMLHLATLTWDYADRLQSVDLGGGGDVY